MLFFLYRTLLGRLLLKVLTRPEISVWCGKFLDSPLSIHLISWFVKKNKIDMDEYEEQKYSCFNEFFYRRIKEEKRPVDPRENSLIAPCDGLLSAYPIRDKMVIPVKGSFYGIDDLLKDSRLAAKYDGGTCLVFRLCVDNYHRYCFLDDGDREDYCYIPGVLHTVRPIALREVPVFTENSREYTTLHTKHCGDVTQIEVGAMLVGKITNHKNLIKFQRGMEKGYFEYGGSTIILLVEKGRVRFPEKLFQYTEQGREVPVKMGQKIGTVLSFHQYD